MIENASTRIERAFRDNGYFAPLFHVVTRDGREALLPWPDDLTKDELAEGLRAFIVEFDVVACLTLVEAWIAKGLNPDEQRHIASGGGIRDMPGRFEAVVLMAENENGEVALGHREIVRPEAGAPHLKPLVMVDVGVGTVGRLANLFPRKPGSILQ
jgi:hypothetical protein